MLCVKVSYMDYYITPKENGNSETVVRMYGTKVNSVTSMFEEKTLIHLHGCNRYFYFTLTDAYQHKKLRALEEEINHLFKTSHNLFSHHPIMPLRIDVCKSIYGFQPNKQRVVSFEAPDAVASELIIAIK